MGFRTLNQAEDTDKVLADEMTKVSRKHVTLRIGEFNCPDINWESNFVTTQRLLPLSG